MVYTSEYSRSEVNGPGCSYANLCSYNSAYTRGVLPPVPSSGVGPAQYLVPSFGTIPGYRSLQHGGTGPTCNGYFSIQNAYGNSDNCSRYSSQLCSSSCGGESDARRNNMAALWY